jgi:uncharacterized protein
MKRVRVIFVIGICIVAGILIAGCTQPSSPTVPATNSGAVVKTDHAVQPSMANPATNSGTVVSAKTSLAMKSSIANPASVNCGSLGGETEIKRNADGSESGMCSFTNGTTCEEWALYRGEGCTTNVTAPAK